MPPRSPPSLLPHFLVVLYALAIVYASLQPFAPWITPPPGTPFFLFAPWGRWPRRHHQAVRTRRSTFRRARAAAPSAGGASSRSRLRVRVVHVETLQMFMPPRGRGDLVSTR
jgi:hypothetical protein